jgi:hypothetical protein
MCQVAGCASISESFAACAVWHVAAIGAKRTCAAASAEVYGSGSGDGNGKTTVVFVCLHGSAKSQMAAAHFNRIASERGLPFTAVSRGIEVDTLIPTRIRDGLNLDGLAPTDDVPIDGG